MEEKTTFAMKALEENTNELVKYATTAMTESLNRDFGILDPEEASMFVTLINLLKANQMALKEIHERIDSIELERTCRTTTKKA